MEADSSSCLSGICNPLIARYIYAIVFLITCFIAWPIRDYRDAAFHVLQWMRLCEDAKDCVGAIGVLRVSLGCSIFFLTMFFTTVGARKLSEWKDVWHSGWWFVKIIMWIITMIIPFLLPFSLIQFYGEIAHYGAGVFLLIQLISVISFIRWVNDKFNSGEGNCPFYAMMVSSISYLLCFLGIIFMYVWYAHTRSCLLNVVIISITLMLVKIMTLVSLHPKVNSGFLTPGLMGLYVVFLCWSAIRSEPPEERCGRKADAGDPADWLTIISFIIALLAMVIATFSTGIDSECFQFKKSDTRSFSDKDIPYGYGFFHIVFATGAMYLAMLLVSWNADHVMRKWTIDVGWTSTWVRIVNEVVAVFVYIWIMVASVIWKSR